MAICKVKGSIVVADVCLSESLLCLLDWPVDPVYGLAKMPCHYYCTVC